MAKQVEYWFDTHHTGCIRIIDHDKKIIYGSDPAEKYWRASFIYEPNTKNKSLIIDFSTKRTHRVNKMMNARYMNNRNLLHWNDGNIWKRIRVDPNIVLRYYKSRHI